MKEYWPVLCFLNVPFFAYGFWLCGHPFFPTWQSMMRRLLGITILIVGGMIMLATAFYPITFLDYFLWFLLTLLAWLIGVAGWTGVGMRTKAPTERGV